MKYIDSEKLIAEIERLKSVLTDPLCSQGNILGPDWVAGGNKMLKEISSVITSLQQEREIVELSFKGGTYRVNGKEHSFKGGKAKVIILEINQEDGNE